MKTQRQQVRLEMSSRSNDKRVCMLEYSTGDSAEMTATSDLFGTITRTATDLFEALTLIRLEIEKHGYIILCNGARLDAYPSRMSRQMGSGGKLYLFSRGVQAERKNLVGMFEPAQYQLVGTVVAQRAAYESWLRSLGSE